MILKNIVAVIGIGFIVATSYSQSYKKQQNATVVTTYNDITFSSDKTVAENLKGAPQFNVLKTFLNNSNLQSALNQKEMVTIFVFTDSAFEKMSKPRRDSIMGNQQLQSTIVKFLTIPGRLDSKTLKDAVKKNGGVAKVTTLEGGELGIKEINGELVIFNETNATAIIEASDFYHKNGFFHIISSVILPNKE